MLEKNTSLVENTISNSKKILRTEPLRGCTLHCVIAKNNSKFCKFKKPFAKISCQSSLGLRQKIYFVGINNKKDFHE